MLPACLVLPALQLRELNLESSEGPLVLESAASLPPTLSKIFAVESHMAEVPGGRAASWQPAPQTAFSRFCLQPDP